MNKDVFTVGEKEYAVLRPTPKQTEEAQLHYNLAIRKAIEQGCLLKQAVDDVLRKQGIWNDEKQELLDDMREKIYHFEVQLKKGGIKKSEAKKIAIEIKRLRFEIQDLVSVRNTLDAITAESHAENARFDYLVFQCLVYNTTGERYFKTLEDYNNSVGDEIALIGAKKLGYMLYGFNEDIEKTLPENKFLLEYGFMNEQMQLVDKKGRLVDTEGKLIDKFGRYVDEDGNFIDRDGKPVDALGNPTIEFTPFLDDDDDKEEIEIETEDVKKQPKKKKAVSQ